MTERRPTAPLSLALPALGSMMGGRVFSGADIGFRSKGVDRGTPVLVPVVKINGEWVEVQLGMPGIQRLTQ